MKEGSYVDGMETNLVKLSTNPIKLGDVKDERQHCLHD